MIQIIEDKKVQVQSLKRIGVIGDPGCDGLGTYNMHVYTAALQNLEDADIILIAGDLVPTGETAFYKRIKTITDKNTSLPVYVLPGNHDTGDYKKAFGLSQYALIEGGTALIALDNKKRCFDDEGLSLLRETLEDEGVETAVVSFHIPVPNRFSPNAVSEAEMDRLFDAMGDNKGKVKLIVCGHVHSRFEDVVRGIPMVCTGGGGALIEDVSADIKASDINHHVVMVTVAGSEASYEIREIEALLYRKEEGDDIALNAAAEAVKNELLASLKYNIYSQRAMRRGLRELSEVFAALARSEYHHARNFYSILTDSFSFDDDFEEYIDTENYEHTHLYKMMANYSKEKEYTLSTLAYESASAAEKVHEKLLSELPEELPGPVYVCPTCGHLMYGDSVVDRCPVCGCPMRDFEEFASND